MNRGKKILIGVGICLFSQVILAEGFHDGVSTPRRPSSPVTSNGLVPAGVNGNPGFSYLVDSEYGPPALCQGTLVSVEEKPEGTVCTVGTADHCLKDELEKASKKGRAYALDKPWCKPELRRQPVRWGKLKIQTADFGLVEAIGMSHPKASEGSLLHDTAVFYFNCPKGAGNVPVVKVDSSPLRPGEDFHYGKVRKRQGLFKGKVFGKRLRAVSSQTGRVILDTFEGNSRDYIDQDLDKTITQGDSGGPGLVYRGGEWKLSSILSGYPTDIGPTKAIYQSGASMDFVACMAGESSPSSAQAFGKKSSIPELRAEPIQAGVGGVSGPSAKKPEESPRAFQKHDFRGNGRGNSRGLHLLRPNEEPSPRNAIYLKRMPDGSRKAAIKDANGQVVILDDETQKELRHYYESHRNKLDKLSAEKRSFVDGFLNSFSSSPGGHQDNTPASPIEAPPSPPPSSQDQLGFECVSSEGGFRPKRSGGNFKLLGASAFKDKAQCEKAVSNARNGVVCSPTEEGFKATHHSGSVAWEEFAGIKAFGYLGGESLSLEECLETTLKSTSKAICYRSASSWLAGDINGSGKLSSGVSRGPYESLKQCNEAIQEKTRSEDSESFPSSEPDSSSREQSSGELSEAARKAIDFYENGMKYMGGHPRERFPQDMFRDLPANGTGKIILAYFGNKDAQLEAAAAKHPLIDVRNYPIGSPEHRHAQLFGTQALGLDGLGRKITRYAMSPREAFNSLASSNEVEHLRRYLEAKNEKPRGTVPNTQVQGQGPEPRQQPRQEPKQQHPPINGREVSALLDSSCIRCHQNQKDLPQSLKSTAGLLEQLRSATDNTLEDMAERAGLNSNQLQQLKNFRDGQSSSSHQGSSRSSGRNRELASSSIVNACYTSDAERRSQIESLPEFDTSGSPIASAVNSALNQGNAVFYNKKSVPRTWQSREQTLLTERNATNPNMYAQMGYHSDGSREFPWDKPAGTDASGETIDSEKFFIPGENGKLAKLVSRTRSNSPSYYGRSENVNGPNMGWNFETGATLGEVLKVKDPETGEGIPFEIRIRRKNNQGLWQMDVLRPFENPADLLGGLKKLCVENKNPPAGCAQVAWSKIEKPEIRVFDSRQFVNRKSLGTRLDPMKLSSTAGSALNQKASLQVLPDMPPDVVRALLKSTPFKSVFGKPWTQGQEGAQEGWAPTTGSNFNIVPKNYFGGFIPMNQVSCMKCHESAGRHVDNFDPKRDEAAGIVNLPSDATRSRTWYNFIPGNDGILSFHPWDANRVKQGGSANRNSLNDCLKRAGLLE